MRKSRAVIYEETSNEYMDDECISNSCKFCSVLHFLGEYLTGNASAPSKPRYSTYYSNIYLTPYFLLPYNCPDCGRGFETETGLSRIPRLSEKCIRYGYEVCDETCNFY